MTIIAASTSRGIPIDKDSEFTCGNPFHDKFDDVNCINLHETIASCGIRRQLYGHLWVQNIDCCITMYLFYLVRSYLCSGMVVILLEFPSTVEHIRGYDKMTNNEKIHVEVIFNKLVEISHGGYSTVMSSKTNNGSSLLSTIMVFNSARGTTGAKLRRGSIKPSYWDNGESRSTEFIPIKVTIPIYRGSQQSFRKVTFNVIATHLPAQLGKPFNKTRKKQILESISKDIKEHKKLRDRYVLVVGDMNCNQGEFAEATGMSVVSPYCPTNMCYALNCTLDLDHAAVSNSAINRIGYVRTDTSYYDKQHSDHAGLVVSFN